MDTLLGLLFMILALVFQFGVVFIGIFCVCFVLSLLGLMPKTEEEQRAMMIGLIVGSAMSKPDDKPPSSDS